MDIRLKKEKDFNLVFSKGKRVYTKSFTLLYIKKEELKVGYTVSKKHGGSVMRNKIKRIFRESFRSFLPQIQQNFFFVFIPKVLENYDFKQIKKDMQFILKRENIIEN